MLLFLAALYWLDKWQKAKDAASATKVDEEQNASNTSISLEIEKVEKEIIALQNENFASEITSAS